jgi:hypothetical protein
MRSFLCSLAGLPPVGPAKSRIVIHPMRAEPNSGASHLRDTGAGRSGSMSLEEAFPPEEAHRLIKVFLRSSRDRIRFLESRFGAATQVAEAFNVIAGSW